jgi:hypothetical protein
VVTWALWLAVPIAATTLASLWTGWRGHRARRAEQLDTAGAMAAHQNYLDALTIPARSTFRTPARDIATPE